MTDLLECAGSFARAIANGDSESAHGLLSDDLRKAITAADLSTQYGLLADEMGGITGTGEPMIMLEEWPENIGRRVGTTVTTRDQPGLLQG